jgi:phosphoserine aminotransferase
MPFPHEVPSERMVIMNMTAPLARPARPYFSSGPCAKRPGWQIQNLQDTPLGRSHRAKAAKTRLKLGIDLTRELLQVPAGYRIGIVPGSDTGAVEMASANAASMCSPGSLLAKAG